MIKYIKTYLLITLLPLFGITLPRAYEDIGHIYCTYADETYFNSMLHLIGSIHKNDFDHLNQIAVFDLQLSPEHRAYLETIEKVKVYDIEITHPDILYPFIGFARSATTKRIVRGWYAWKAVAIKQMCEMFPYFINIDAGALVLRSPKPLFDHIRENGYFLLDVCPHNITDFNVEAIREKIIPLFSPAQQERILAPDSYLISAGFMGISRDIYESFVLPVYQHTFDLSLFADDGTAKGGLGWSCHDQSIYSIYSKALNMYAHPAGWMNLRINNQDVPFHVHHDGRYVIEETTIYQNRGDTSLFGNQSAYIRYKNTEEI